MNLEKKLLKYYLKSNRLSAGNEELKKLKASFQKLKKNSSINSTDIQQKLDEHFAILRLTKQNADLTYASMQIRNRLISALKDIGYPAARKITLDFEGYGLISFWYKESNVLLFEKAD